MFAVKVTRTNCPWVFARGEPFRVIASLELLGTLLCWLAFGRDASPKGPGMSFSGSTDNMGNAHVIDRRLTTKFPLCAILMELSAQLSRAGASLTLDWIPRLQNTEADELSNGITTSFQEVNRVHLDLGNLDLLILPELIGYGSSLYEALDKRKLDRAGQQVAPGGRRAERPRGSRLRETDPW